MLPVTRPFLAVFLYLTLSLLVFSQSARSRESARTGSEPPVIYGQMSVEWPAAVPDAGILLAISGPAGLYVRQENPAGTWGRFSLVNEQGQMRPDGIYKWELVSQAGWEVEQIDQVESGWFEIKNGKVVAEGTEEKQPMVVEEQAPASSLFLDSQGRVGLGTSVPASQLHLKGILPAVTLEDTATGGSLFTWRGLEKGDGSLGLFDEAGQVRWLVDREGRIGINTTKPTATLTVDGYIESTRGFLVNGRPLAAIGLIGGRQPLFSEGVTNSFFGSGAGALTTGGFNSFFGASAGAVNTTGLNNAFFGYYAGHANIGGYENCFFGAWAGMDNTTGYDNSFFGHNAGRNTSSGTRNAFVGAYAGSGNTTGQNNSFIGESAGYANSTGSRNTFVGRQVGQHQTVENNNTLLGAYADLDPGADPAGSPVTNATAIGYRSYVRSSNSLVLGGIAGLNGATSYVNVGIGTATPVRQLHLAGTNAVFRMDRPSDTAAFILVRTDATGTTPLKTFVVGTNATGPNQGEFIINDIGTAVGGDGNRRMTISNEGNVTFTGNVYAASFTPTSSLAFKTNIRTFENALETVNRLRGVRFDWKDSGKPAVGLIAEEVDEVVPEVVAHEGDAVKGVNYANLVAVLVEAVKEQQKTIREERSRNEQQQAELDALKAKLEKFEALLRGR